MPFGALSCLMTIPPPHHSRVKILLNSTRHKALYAWARSIQRTAAQFGFKTTWGHNLSLDQVIDIANHGRPVIVSFPPDRYAGGHLLVVTGGDANYVYLADSSLWNRHSLSRNQFLQWWEGFSAIVTPK